GARWAPPALASPLDDGAFDFDVLRRTGVVGCRVPAPLAPRDGGARTCAGGDATGRRSGARIAGAASTTPLRWPSRRDGGRTSPGIGPSSGTVKRLNNSAAPTRATRTTTPEAPRLMPLLMLPLESADNDVRNRIGRFGHCLD